jgi:hypothetical protein
VLNEPHTRVTESYRVWSGYLGHSLHVDSLLIDCLLVNTRPQFEEKKKTLRPRVKVRTVISCQVSYVGRQKVFFLDLEFKRLIRDLEFFRN